MQEIAKCSIIMNMDGGGFSAIFQQEALLSTLNQICCAYTWQFLALFISRDKARKNINFSQEKREM